MYLIQRMTAGYAVPVGLEQLGPQPPRLDAETLAGQLAAALVGGLIAGLGPDRPGRDREDRAAPGPEQAARGPVRLAPARLEQAQRHVDADDAGLVPLNHSRQRRMHADRVHPQAAGPRRVQADRDPAPPAGIHSGYAHTATVTHLPCPRAFSGVVRRGSHTTAC